MKIAAIYDIHGNLPALEAVLAEIERESVDLVVIGGDVVMGPMPKESLALLQSIEWPTAFIWGNGEAELLRCVAGKPIGGLSERANKDARWLAETLTADEIAFIRSWSNTYSVETAELGKVIFCHATPHSNIQVFTAKAPDELVEPIFADVEAQLVVCGHTHMQFDRQIGDVRVVNAGSVGMPFGSLGAYWLLLDTAVHFKHTDYDLEATAQIIRESGYPDADSFVSGNVLSSPSVEQIGEVLAQIQQRQLGQDLSFD